MRPKATSVTPSKEKTLGLSFWGFTSANTE